MIRNLLKFTFWFVLIVGLVIAAYYWVISSTAYDNYLISSMPDDTIYCRQDKRPITHEELNKKLKNKGVFKEKADAFIHAAEKYNVDPTLVASIALFETGKGTSNAVKNYNNPGGLMDPKNPMEFLHFSSLEQGIEAMTANLYRNYIQKGLHTPAQIAPIYAPIGAKNDIHNTNSHWAPTVIKFINYLGGLVEHCQVQKD